mmetsp:Transcript_147163/g.455221  ORF Transcript_147163/g.455221 Transcript_147163/m.455221 type:complete len:88 (-) Transcript_147163:28-291(-)
MPRPQGAKGSPAPQLLVDFMDACMRQLPEPFMGFCVVFPPAVAISLLFCFVMLVSRHQARQHASAGPGKKADGAGAGEQKKEDKKDK